MNRRDLLRMTTLGGAASLPWLLGGPNLPAPRAAAPLVERPKSLPALKITDVKTFLTAPANLTIAGGELGGSGTLTVPSGVTVDVQGGTLGGPGTLAVQAGGSMHFGTNPSTLDRTLTNAGTLLIDGPADADPWGVESLWSGEQVVGRATGGGFSVAFHKQIALGFVRPEFAGEGTELLVRMLGQKFPARVVQDSPYDAENAKARA